MVVVVEAPAPNAAEFAVRAVTAALSDLADQNVTIQAIPLVGPGEGEAPGQPGWLAHAANMARSPWVLPWQGGREYGDSYLLDLACARECSQADAVGHAGTAYAFTSTLEPVLARREFFASGDAVPGLHHFSAS